MTDENAPVRFYVYALIDPTKGNRPFYIGKGLAGRLQSHFTELPDLGTTNDSAEIIGCDTVSLLADAREHLTGTKAERLSWLLAQGYTHRDIARVIARRLCEPAAFALESFLIRSVYGLDTLHNRVEGAHAERFRPKDQFSFIAGFDLEANEAPHRAAHYVYALRCPEDGRVFYVGKGTGNRLWQHFRDAGSEKNKGKLTEIRRLLRLGHRRTAIARILAWVDDEPTAFAVEALALKFIYGLSDLENIQTGHHHGFFRAKDDWDMRKGFDLPFVVFPGERQDRSEALDGMLGEGLDRPLLEIQRRFPELRFDPPKVLDAADLGVEADVLPRDGSAGARIKIFIRRERIQIELRHRRKAQREWIQMHFKRLGAYPLRRRDDVFFPDSWRGAGRMTADIDEAVLRVGQLLQIINARSSEDLPEETRRLLKKIS